MVRYWTFHWQFRFWRNDINTEFEPLDSSGSNNFVKRGVLVGDVVYVVSLSGGQLYLGGRMTVKQIVSRTEAVSIFRTQNLYHADEWVIDKDPSGTPLNLHRRLAPEITRQIRCVMADGSERGLFFVSDTHLDVQATRGIRQLTPESAELLDRIITFTDATPRTGRLVTVTEAMLTTARQ
jgi:hypothetical protein